MESEREREGERERERQRDIEINRDGERERGEREAARAANIHRMIPASWKDIRNVTILAPLRQGFMFLCVCDYVCSLLLKYNDCGGPHAKI